MTKQRRRHSLFCAISIAACAVIGAPAYAASLNFIYTGANAVDENGNPIASINDVLTFDLVMDFTDEATLGGIFDIAFDSTALEFVSYNDGSFGDPAFARSPTVEFNLLRDVAFGDFNGISGPAVFAQLSFAVIDSGFTTIAFTESTSFSTGFINAENFLTIDDVDYGNILINAPLPAAAWLLLSACGALGLSTRRRQIGDAAFEKA